MVYPLALALMGASVRRKSNEDEQDRMDREAERVAREEERKARADDRAFLGEQRTRMRADWTRQDANRDRLAAAAAPVAPTDGSTYQPAVDDDGNPMPPNPTAGRLKVGDQVFTDRAAAEAAAAAERTARMSAAMEQGGDLVGAQSLRTGMRQEQAAVRQGKLAELQLDDAQRAFLNRGFDETLGALGSFDDLAGFLTRAEGSAAGITLRAQQSADGKKVMLVQVMPDGTTRGTKQEFDNSPEGLTKAKASLARTASIQDKMTWLHQQAQEETARRAASAAERAAMRAGGPARQTLSQQIAELEQALGRLLTPQERAAKLGVGAAPAGPIWDKKADEFLLEKATREDPETKRKVVDGGMLQFGKAIAPAISSRNGGDWVGAIGAAMQQDERLRALATDPKTGYDQVKHDSLRREAIAQLSAPPAPARPQMPPGTPAAAIAAAPPGGGMVVDGKWVPQGSAAPAAAQVPFQDFLAQNIGTPSGRQEIAKRIRQDLPQLQAQIQGDLKVMAMPMVTGAVKARLKARVEEAQQQVDQMTTFMAGNIGL